ncbi:acetate--CoA ligase family protein [Acuticoccus sp.]|uniref:acetate--CoA ligase family protein n=1 Tax=Acuticoccus sp. TaxID=1904378 RepID=UPI003B52D47C
MSRTTLADLLTPRSVAIVGASDNPLRIGGRPLSYMKSKGFGGAIYPVNPTRDTVQGLTAYPSLDDIGADVDFVLVATPAATVPEVVRQAAERNAKAVLIFSSGFAEMNAAGGRLQDEIVAVARETGVRVIGPNCLGLYNSAHNFYPTFSGTIERLIPRPGGVAIASQSGAYGSHIGFLAQQKGLGISYWLTTGNECDVHVAEVIELLAREDDVHTICAYAEGVKDGAVLMRALETARAARKPVVFMKVGRSTVGAAAASSHTASLAGEDRVYDAVLREFGAWRARSTEEMLDVAYAARPRIYPAGRKLGIVTISGGAGVLMADAAEDAGLEAPEMPRDVQDEIVRIVPFASARNPVDVTAQFFNDLTLVPRFTAAMLDRGGYDGLVGFWSAVASSPTLAKPLLDGLNQAMGERRDKLFINSIVAPDDIRALYEAQGYPCFEDPTRAVEAMAAMMFFGEAFDHPPRAEVKLPAPSTLPLGPVGEREAKAVLAAAGLPMVEDRLATSREAAVAAARELGGPVALKVASADVLHKSDVGGVRLGVEGDAAGEAYDAILAAVRKHVPGATVDGVLVSPMVGEGVDTILGAKVDPVFGPIVLFGLGGIFTEVLKDVACRPAPVDPGTARAMIDELSGAALLKGARGTPPADLAALAEAIAALSRFAAANADRLESVEINPLRASADGVIALDALLVTTQENGGPMMANTEAQAAPAGRTT